MALREILVELGVDVDEKKARKQVENIRKGLVRMGKDGEAATKRVKGSMNGLVKVAKIAGGIFLAGKLAQGFKFMMKNASDSSEVINKLRVIFGQDLKKDLVAFSEELGQATGKGRGKIQQLLGDAGSLIKPFVGSAEAAAQMSKEITALALDTASLENREPEDVLIAFKSALVGMSRPLLNLGIDARQAALQQFALSKGIKTAVKDMDNKQVTKLRLELIKSALMEKGIVGDATRTAGSYANRLRALGDTMVDVSSDIGTELLPAMADLLGSFSSFLRKTSKGVIAALKYMTRLFRGLKRIFTNTDNALGKLNLALLIASGTALGLGIAFKKAGATGVKEAIKIAKSWILLNVPMFLTIVLLGIIIAAILLLIDDFTAMGDGAESVTGTLIQGFMDLVDSLGGIGPAIWEILKTALVAWFKFFKKLGGISFNFIWDVIKGWMNAIYSFNKWWISIMIGVYKSIGQFAIDKFKSIFNGIMKLMKPVLKFFGKDNKNEVNFEKITNIAATGGAGVSSMAAPTNNSSMINQPKTDIKIEVNADQTGSSAQDIAGTVASMVGKEIDKRDRQTMQAFTVAPQGT